MPFILVSAEIAVMRVSVDVYGERRNSLTLVSQWFWDGLENGLLQRECFGRNAIAVNQFIEFCIHYPNGCLLHSGSGGISKAVCAKCCGLDLRTGPVVRSS